MGIFLSHLGLYVILLAGIAGSSDTKRTFFYLENDKEPTNLVKDFYSNTVLQTPFKLKLDTFDITEYNPKIVLVKYGQDGMITPNSNKHFIIGDSLSEEFLDWRIEIKEFHKYSYPEDSLYSSFKEVSYRGSVASAFVEVYDKEDNLINKDWITCGNFVWERKNISINKDYYFAMLSPEPKEYSSDLTAYLPDGTQENFTIKVNSPKTIMGWKLYQTSYDEKRGKWSNYSLIEAGHDPWLPFVFTGMFILIAGAFYLFWLGSKAIEEDEQIDN